MNFFRRYLDTQALIYDILIWTGAALLIRFYDVSLWILGIVALITVFPTSYDDLEEEEGSDE